YFLCASPHHASTLWKGCRSVRVFIAKVDLNERRSSKKSTNVRGPCNPCKACDRTQDLEQQPEQAAPDCSNSDRPGDDHHEVLPFGEQNRVCRKKARDGPAGAERRNDGVHVGEEITHLSRQPAGEIEHSEVERAEKVFDVVSKGVEEIEIRRNMSQVAMKEHR